MYQYICIYSYVYSYSYRPAASILGWLRFSLNSEIVVELPIILSVRVAVEWEWERSL